MKMDAKTLEVIATIRQINEGEHIPGSGQRLEKTQAALAGLSVAQLQSIIDSINERTKNTRIPLARTGSKGRLAQSIAIHRRFVRGAQ